MGCWWTVGLWLAADFEADVADGLVVGLLAFL
jgi:hypothetical protein